MSSKKKIGIVGWNTGDNSFGITKPYAEFFGHFGQLIILGPDPEPVDLDLLVLPGGKDISSFLYGRRPSFYNSDADVMKEYFMNITLPKYIRKGTPIFGICLGMQQINVHFGGKMLQNIAHEYSTESRGEKVHDLYFHTEDFAKYNGTGKKAYKVNSLHHQAVDPRYIPECLEIVATDGDDKNPIVEIIRHRELPIVGVQYHPEEIVDSVSISLITQLLNCAIKA